MDRINVFIDGPNSVRVSPHAMKTKQSISRAFRERGLKAHFNKISIKDTSFGEVHMYKISRSVLDSAVE